MLNDAHTTIAQAEADTRTGEFHSAIAALDAHMRAYSPSMKEFMGVADASKHIVSYVAAIENARKILAELERQRVQPSERESKRQAVLAGLEAARQSLRKAQAFVYLEERKFEKVK